MTSRFPHILTILAIAATTHAQVTVFDLEGNGGSGLLGGNELHATTTPGSGGEIGGGISFDAATNILTINVGWGSSNGFTDLTGAATGAHIHGPANQNSTAGVLINFASDGSFSFTTGATNGSITGSIDFDTDSTAGTIDTDDLLAGLWYINIHTSTNAAGEIRGNLSAVPEPAGFAMWLAVGSLTWVGSRRRSR